MFRQGFLLIALLGIARSGITQSLNDSISPAMVEETVTALAANKLKGRVNYSLEQLEAAVLLADKFREYGLLPFPGYHSYFQPFFTGSPKEHKTEKLWINDREINDSLYYFFPSSPRPAPAVTDDFFILQVFPPVSDSLLFTYWEKKEKILVWIILNDTVSFSSAGGNLVIPPGMPASDLLILGSKQEPSGLKLLPSPKPPQDILYNVVGILPGREKTEEAVLFSAHYDHVDKGINAVSGEIFNGANDNASGTTAVLALARYFALRNDNNRTLVFSLFAGEEIGLLGSNAFAGQVSAEHIKAVINIEMIGMFNATGKDAFMVTGPSYSTLFPILEKNLKGEKFRVTGLDYDPRQLFRRSDNFTFYNLGIPAHSIMCSDDKEPCYHRPCDDARRIDFANMTKVIQAIAKSCHSIISGDDTPMIKNNER